MNVIHYFIRQLEETLVLHRPLISSHCTYQQFVNVFPCLIFWRFVDPPKDLLTHLKANLRDVTVKAIKKPSYEIKINVMRTLSLSLAVARYLKSSHALYLPHLPLPMPPLVSFPLPLTPTFFLSPPPVYWRPPRN
eukprot:GHVT01104270.1.p2 GENE.GHVT01104270.1~~GHVT01104270.1.p2  ORF type:complete len:135 (-),score=3.78 GHVT01104270.1:1747-2151(-)